MLINMTTNEANMTVNIWYYECSGFSGQIMNEFFRQRMCMTVCPRDSIANSTTSLGLLPHALD